MYSRHLKSLVDATRQVILAQGLAVGIGLGGMLLPGVAVMPQYFIQRRAFATGIAAAGSSLGKCSIHWWPLEVTYRKYS